MKHGFIKAASATPHIRLADTEYNKCEHLRLIRDAEAHGVGILVFPELSLTGATCGDLFFQPTLQNGALLALKEVLSATENTNMLIFLGLPLTVGSRLCNVTAALFGGKLLGLLPKVPVTAYEARAARQFSLPTVSEIPLFDASVPVGRDLLFVSRELPALRVTAVLGEALPDVSATVVANPCAIPEIVGEADARRRRATAEAERLACAWVLSDAADGESTTDLVFGGHAILAEGHRILAETPPFAACDGLTVTEFDTLFLLNEQKRKICREDAHPTREIFFSLPLNETPLTRAFSPLPFIPAEPEESRRRCETVLTIQSTALARRIERACAKRTVIGISGGLDSTLALLVTARAADRLQRERKSILAVTMPCFGTTDRTKSNATLLCEHLGVELRTVNIFDAVNQHFKDIGQDPLQQDVTYENAQARERTQVLMDLANQCGGMVIGTGDLSELALGWATYNGDHMSMYGVNASIPKTLVRHLVSYEAEQADACGESALAEVLRDILATPVSPELLPAQTSGEIAQKTEDLVGPYELHDFYLYHTVRRSASPEKIFRLASYAFGNAYDAQTLLKWLEVFTKRFFSQQFKRSCLPDAPKVGTLSLSPRGEWQMPSDASAELWFREITELKQKLHLQ